MNVFQSIHDHRSRLYRVGILGDGAGLWYDSEGRETRLINRLSEGKAKYLPMEPHPVFRSCGHRWISCTDSIAQLRNWFSCGDMIELVARGYQVLEIEVSGYRTFDFGLYAHQVYSDHQVHNIRPISPALVYPQLEEERAAA